MSSQFYVRRGPMEYLGKTYDRGQLVAIGTGLNDEKLIRLGYVAEVQKNTVLKECGECGVRFIGEGERNGHVKIRHVERFLSPEEEDEALDRQEQMLEQVAPLFLDKTKASLESGAASIEVQTPSEPALTKRAPARNRKTARSRQESTT